MKQYATYLRVSTQRQGAQGLGISAQRNMCENFIKQNNGQQVREFMDVESGTHRDRKGLWQAIDYCKKNDCRLVIAKLDRMSRDVEFTFKVINTGIDIHFTDMPVVNSMILGVFAAVAQYEREMISSRTKAALAVKKAQGCKMGAASQKYRESYNKLTEEQKLLRNMRKGILKRQRHQQKPEFLAFKKILKKVFPDYTTSDDVRNWKWGYINLKRENRDKVLELMQDCKDLDTTGQLFRKFDFENDMTFCETRIHQYLQAFRKSCVGSVKEV